MDQIKDATEIPAPVSIEGFSDGVLAITIGGVDAMHLTILGPSADWTPADTYIWERVVSAIQAEVVKIEDERDPAAVQDRIHRLIHG
jgi:hypothetical protein